MALPEPGQLPQEFPLFRQIADSLAQQGWCYLPAAAPEAMSQALLQQALALEPETFMPAGVGRQAELQRNEFVRRDRIRWINGQTAAEREWLQWTERLRCHLNRQLFMGLFSFESHFSCYPANAFYRRHVDAFRGEANRVVSIVLYLNPGWSASDGGALVLYRESPALQSGGEEIGRFLPAFGSLAVFLSEEFPHEVLPTRRSRYSVAGWFRINTTTGLRPDPAS